MVGVADGDDQASERPQFAVEQVGAGADVVTLRVSGQLDVSTEAVLRELLEEAVATEPDTIVLEADDLNFMDSSGLAVLLVAARQVERLELRNPTQIVRRVIGVAGLAGTLRMTPDE